MTNCKTTCIINAVINKLHSFLKIISVEFLHFEKNGFNYKFIQSWVTPID
jgi:hypothetical protein